MIAADSGLEGVAFAVCTVLAGTGITAILTGGSAATVHSCWRCAWKRDGFFTHVCVAYIDAAIAILAAKAVTKLRIPVGTLSSR